MKANSFPQNCNLFPAMKRNIRLGLSLSSIGAVLLGAGAALAVQPSANMTAVLSPSTLPPVRAAADPQQKLAAAAGAEGVQIEWNAALGTPFSIRGKNLGERRTYSAGKGLKVSGSAQPEVNAIAVLDNLSGIMGVRDAQAEFTAKGVESDSIGFRHVRACQKYKGLKVFGGEVIVHFNKSGEAYQVNGRYAPDIAVDIIPGLAPEEVADLAAQDLAGLGKSDVAVAVDPELVIFAYQSQPRLAYALTMTADLENANAWRYWIDAQDGKVLMRYNDVKSVDISGAILTGEGGATNTVHDCQAEGGTNYLYRTSNWFWLVANTSTNTNYVDHASPSGALYIAFRTNTTWIPEDRTEMSAAYNFDLIQNYYRNVQGRQSYNGSNGIVGVFVHYEDPDWTDNASWQGGGLVLIGEGDGVVASGMAVMDVCGHEFTHGVTEYSANLIYAYEPGALNESFSDIFGASIEFNSQPDGRTNYPGKVPGTADWLMGEDCWLSSTALRDMRAPTNTATVGSGGEQPNHYKGPYWYYGSMDNGGVHYNSGVQNYFFYLLSEGGTNVYNGTTTVVAGIGVSNAAQVAYRALAVYCYEFTDYAEIRAAWISAAQDLNPSWVASVVQAWEAVGYGNNTLTDLGTALNSPYLTWYTGGNSNWFAESTVTHDGVLAAQSGHISHNQQSRLQTTVTGPGTLSFWWKVSSEYPYDYLRFFVDDVEQTKITGETDWALKTYSVGSGAHTVRWIYNKDFIDTEPVGFDAGWVDQVSWAPNWSPTMPAISATKGVYSDRIRIVWPVVSGATDYLIYRYTSDNSSQAQPIGNVTGTLFDDTGAASGTVYYYWIKARNCATVSGFSGMDTGYRSIAPPTGLTASKGSYTDSIRLTWVAAVGATSYQVFRNTSPNSATATLLYETGMTSYSDVTAVPRVTYYYWLKSRKWSSGGMFATPFSIGDSGWRRSMASTDNAFCDFDGDGKADPAVYRRTTGQWIIMMSANLYRTANFQLGGTGYVPVPQDFDGDGKTDVAVYSGATGRWQALLSSCGYALGVASIGEPGSIPIPRDFDGDGKADPAVYHQPSGLWKMLCSGQRYNLTMFYYGNYSYGPYPADFDNDSKTDPAVFQVRSAVMGELGCWFASLSGSAYATYDWELGRSGQLPVPQDYDGDRKADPAVYDAAAGLLSYLPSSTTSAMPYFFNIGGTGFIAVAGDYDGDKKADAAVYRESTATWVVLLSANNNAPYTLSFGGPGYQAASALQ